jgi:hypothetical protein
MTSATAEPRTVRPSKGLDRSLWIVQWLLAVTFAPTGVWKVAAPADFAAKFPWGAEVSPVLFYATALSDTLGGLGVLLPSLTRIKPELTVLAALGCAALQVSAIIFHFARGEAANTPFNFLLVALSLFVAWGRRAKAPITPRT